MAYDRYDARRGRHRGEERGFFERAGDEISSWFGEDDSHRHHHREEGMSRGSWDRDRDEGDRYAMGGWGEHSGSDSARRDRYGERGYGRYRGGDEDRSAARPMDWTSSNSDYRSGYRGYDRDYSPGGGYEASGYTGAFTGSDYDRSHRDQRRPESNWERDDYRRTSYAGSTRQDDRHYDNWRQRQMSELDRDYEQYCRERQEHFERDFGSWREKRMTKRQHLGGIKEHMNVVGSDGQSIGKVDCVRGDRVILTKSDSDDNLHHSFDCSMIDSIEEDRIRLEVPAEEAKSRLRDEERGAFRRDDDDRPTLERSFSGTYTS